MIIFNDGDILEIKNTEGISDLIWYTKNGEDETSSELTVGEKVNVMFYERNKYDRTNIYYLSKDDLISQNFTEKEMELIFQVSRKKLNFDDTKVIEDIYKRAKEEYKNGIAVPVENGHPCGWEWLSFEYLGGAIEDDGYSSLDIWVFEDEDISNGCGTDCYYGLTLKEVLKKTNGRFAFEVNGNNIDWDND
jgi:hypothetical protein